MSEEKHIGYRPEINYEKSYESDIGTYQNKTNNTLNKEQNIEETQKDPIEENIEIIDDFLRGPLPTKLRNNVSEIYKPLKDTYYNFIHNQVISNKYTGTKYIENTLESEYGIYLNKSAISMKKGSEILLIATCVPTMDPNNVVAKWESSNEEIAIVDDGIVTGLKAGNVVIKVTSSYNKTDECVVSVLETNASSTDNNKPDTPGDNNEPNPIIPKPPIGDPDKPTNGDEDGTVHIEEVALDRTNIIVKVGHSKQLNATIYPKNVSNKKLIWSCMRNDLATVSQSGLVTGVKVGECMVTVASEDGNKTDTCNVLVIDNNDTNRPNINPNPDNNNPDNNKPNIKPNPKPNKPDKDNNNHIHPDPPPHYPPGTKPDPDDMPDNPDDMPKVDDSPFIIIRPPKPTPTTVEKEFNRNLYDLLNNYMSRLKNILSRFYRSFCTVINGKDLNDYFFIYNNVQISNKDIVSSYRHLLDSALRSENMSNVKLDFYNNNFNFNQTLAHLKNFISMYELRKKYESIPYAKNTDKSASLSNNVLKACRNDYSLKYDKTYENLFRYMDSSLVITDNVVSDLITNVLTKGILTEKGGRSK